MTPLTRAWQRLSMPISVQAIEIDGTIWYRIVLPGRVRLTSDPKRAGQIYSEETKQWESTQKF